MLRVSHTLCFSVNSGLIPVLVHGLLLLVDGRGRILQIRRLLVVPSLIRRSRLLLYLRSTDALSLLDEIGVCSLPGVLVPTPQVC